MNALTRANTLVQDQLFATLDTTVRRMELNDGLAILLSDTVGFIRKLPHHLIASFQTIKRYSSLCTSILTFFREKINQIFSITIEKGMKRDRK